MNILVSVNSTFLKPLKVMLYSLFVNNPVHTTVYLMNTKLSDEEVQQLNEFVLSYGKKMEVITIPESVGDDWPLTGWYSKETYYRLLIMEYLPQDMERILWLDADMVVNNSIEPLYNMEFDGADAVVCQSINEHPEVYLEKLGLPLHQKYFNAGMILFNLAGMRSKYDRNYLVDYLVKNVDKLQLQDQDVLNGAIGANCRFVDHMRYNMMHFYYTRFTEEERDFIFKETAILHYLGQLKPWSSKYYNPTSLIWLKYAKKVYGSGFYYSRMLRYHLFWGRHRVKEALVGLIKR